MKEILLSVKPKYVAKILNGEKTIEIRKRFPKNYRGWVYICVTKGEQFLFKDIYAEKGGYEPLYYLDNKEHDSWSQKLNGKVVARFYCDNVEDILGGWEEIAGFYFFTDTLCQEELEGKSQLTYDELCNSVTDDSSNDVFGYAVHISQLEIFDKPKELWEFYKEFPRPKYLKVKTFDQKKCYAFGDFYEKTLGKYKTEKELKDAFEKEYQLTKAPRSYMYVEEVSL